jgi:hypothetical protein
MSVMCNSENESGQRWLYRMVRYIGGKRDHYSWVIHLCVVVDLSQEREVTLERFLSCLKGISLSRLKTKGTLLVKLFSNVNMVVIAS